jgi:hypothetical protein
MTRREIFRLVSAAFLGGVGGAAIPSSLPRPSIDGAHIAAALPPGVYRTYWMRCGEHYVLWLYNQDGRCYAPTNALSRALLNRDIVYRQQEPPRDSMVLLERWFFPHRTI